MIAKAKGGALDTAPYYPPGSKQHEDNKRNFLKDSAVQHPVYHGSWQDIPEFKRTNKSPGFTALGHWFTSEPPEASSFAGAGFSDEDRKRMHPTSGAGSVYPVHLSIKNPLEFSSAKEFWDWAKDYALRYGHGNKAEGEGTRDWGSQWVKADPDAIRERLRLGNKDGIIIRGGGESDNYPTKGDWFIALHPHQIKSAIGNRGTYDPNEADISKAEGGAVENKDVRRALMIAKEDREANKARYLKGSKAPARLYHGTNAPEDFSEFSVGTPVHEADEFGDATMRVGSGHDPSTYLGSHFAEEPEVANKFAKGLYGAAKGATSGNRVYPVHLAIKNPHITTDSEMREWMLSQKYDHPWVEDILERRPDADWYEHDPVYRRQVNGDALERERNEDEPTFELAQDMAHKYRDHLIKKGHDGIKYKNEVEGGTSWVAFKPEQIKSAIGNRGTFDPNEADIGKAEGGAVENKEVKRALMIARDQRALLRRVANIYPGPAGGMDPSPGGGGYSGPGGGKYIGPSHYAEGGAVDHEANKARFLKGSAVRHPVYHGTSDDIQYFSLTHPNRKDAGWLGHGIYLTESPQIANAYATQKRGNAAPNVMKLHARITKPYYATTADKQKLRMIEHHDGREAAQQAAVDWTNELRAKGHDGVIYEGPIKGSTEYVVFDPENVKSATGNRGTFDTSTDDVNYADGGGVDDYGGEHRPPGPEDGAPLHDLTGQGRVYPDDIYGPNAARYYGHGDDPLDHGTMSIIRQFKGRPSAMAAIYRAVPAGITTAEKLADLEKAMAANMRRGVVPKGESNVGSVWYNKAHAERARLRALPPEPETKTNINPGDWVTINRQYAKDHGESTLRGKYKIIRKTVRADELYTDGNSIHEYGYWPRTQRADGGSVPPFKLYSGAAKIIGAKGQAKATPQQYAAMPGIKPDELKYSKFDTLGSKALPREEVIKHLEANRLPIEETQLGGEGRNTSTQFHGPETTLPGGKNYREVLLHTPPASADAHRKVLADLEQARQAKADAFAALRQANEANAPNRSDMRTAYAQAIMRHDELQDKAAQSNRDAYANNYKSSHWDEPNVLAHVRMSDRRGPNGEKVLHVEEVQSDWGQQGRERGFTLPQITKDDVEYQKIPWKQYAAEESMADYTRDWRRENGHPEDADVVRYRLRGGLDSSGRPVGWNSHGDPNKSHDDIFEMARSDNDSRTSFGERNAQSRRGIPRGPYVDNTQKWTDLALKRVLHEAAHGGYDKIVVTPGDEQNKRYDLSSQVKNIQYYPDIGYLHATTHDNQGVEHNDVKPEDLSKHIGKEAADRILKQGMQRYEGRGKLGGEFYHELKGDGLKMGGAGMRGYYDNILPKRLQALAQQHDPQAKVQLGGYALKTPQNIEDLPEDEQADYYDRDPSGAQRQVPDARRDLHSLDVTPQMRDSIKANGFNSFKRGGEVDDDPIKDWQWRPTEDVRNELQLDEIPSHVHKFGEFMDETARRAATQGLTPRDLIKAYAITRSSIGRGALPVATVRHPKNPEYGFDALPKGLQGTLRPEGAMGHWLHTKMGQRYLDEAEAGRVDEEAVRDAIKSMGAFGLPESAEGKALRWAPKNLPGQEGRVSELIARAHRGQSSPEEWRGQMRVPGIAESKAGFFASMLGRGDQPTLDARQIILNTGQSTKKAAPHLSPKGAKEAAVNRLAGRQTELGLKHDKSMSPFYQHLTHHAIWDKTGGEETTHDDLMQALRGAKDGGRQGYAKGGGGDKPLSLIEGHPVAQGLSMALPPEAELQQLLRKAGIVRPYNQPSQADVERALEIAKTYAMPLGVGSKDDPSAYYGVKQPTAARDVTTKAGATAGFSLKPEKAMSWKEFGAIGKGGHVVNLSGDRTRFGTLHEINGQPLNWPVKVYAGPDYIREPVKGRAWASAPGVISALNRTVTDLSKKGPVFGMYSPYGATGGDFAHHMFDAVMAQVNPDQISKSAKKKFDAAMRDASFIMGQTDKDKSKRERVKPRMEDWPGVDDPKAASEFARKNLTGDHRKAILEYLDKKSWTDEGFPHVGMTRVAVTDPKLLKVPQNVIGGNVALLTPSDTPLSSKHPSYSAGQPGEYVGTLPFAPRHYALPVTTGHFVKTPSAGKGVYVDPYSLNDRARGGYRTLFERNYVPEPVSNQMAEGAEEGIRKMPLYGLKRGGSVSRALDIARKINGR